MIINTGSRLLCLEQAAFCVPHFKEMHTIIWRCFLLYCNLKPNAAAMIRGSQEYPNLHGRVLFFQQKDGVLVKAEIVGLPKNEAGFFGFHIHEGKACGGEAFPNVGGHLNPQSNPHPSHIGDLPPLLSCGGKASMTVKTCRFRVREIIGRTVIIHFGSDDFRTQPSGNAGEKIACGEIRSV